VVVVVVVVAVVVVVVVVVVVLVVVLVVVVVAAVAMACWNSLSGMQPGQRHVQPSSRRHLTTGSRAQRGSS